MLLFHLHTAKLSNDASLGEPFISPCCYEYGMWPID